MKTMRPANGTGNTRHARTECIKATQAIEFATKHYLYAPIFMVINMINTFLRTRLGFWGFVLLDREKK